MDIPIRSGVPQNSLVGSTLVKYLADSLYTLMLLFADDVKMVTRRVKTMNFLRSHFYRLGLPANQPC